MSIKRFKHLGYGVLETNRVDHSKMESQCIVAVEEGLENGMIATVDKRKGEVNTSDSGLKGLVFTSERIYNQFTPGLKYFHIENGEPVSILFLEDGNTFTTNTLCYDDSDFANEEAIKTHLSSSPVYATVENGVIKVTKTATGAFGEVVKYTTMPDGQDGLKFIVTNESTLSAANA